MNFVAGLFLTFAAYSVENYWLWAAGIALMFGELGKCLK